MNLGWIGLGDMGQVIVPRLLEAGHTVTGWNRTAAKAEPLLAKGMVWADTPREVAAASEIVFSMVTDAAAVQAVALGDDGVIAGLDAGKIWLGAADDTVFRKRGVEFVDGSAPGSFASGAESATSTCSSIRSSGWMVLPSLMVMARCRMLISSRTLPV